MANADLRGAIQCFHGHVRKTKRWLSQSRKGSILKCLLMEQQYMKRVQINNVTKVNGSLWLVFQRDNRELFIV